MRILLTNDDGIEAPGIRALHTALQGLGEVTTVAPFSVQSATSHGVTFDKPMFVHERRMPDGSMGYAVDGRPADCVKVALRSLWAELHGEGSLPDLTISGMNAGANVGINVIYSGTVAAAVESAFLGVPSIAVSLHLGDRTRIHFDRAAAIARTVIDGILERPLDPHAVLNVNVPRTETPDAPMPEVVVCPMNTAAASDGFERRTSPGGQPYYWPAGNGMVFDHTHPETDVETLIDRKVTVTPLEFDLTAHSGIGAWRERLSES